MDQQPLPTLLNCLEQVPDPQRRRGQRFEWRILLAIISAAMASGQKTPHAIAGWVEVRGTSAHGQPLVLVSLARHGSGYVLGEVAVPGKSHKIPAVPRLLAGRDLRSTVTTIHRLECNMKQPYLMLDFWLLVFWASEAKGFQPQRGALHRGALPPWAARPLACGV